MKVNASLSRALAACDQNMMGSRPEEGGLADADSLVGERKNHRIWVEECVRVGSVKKSHVAGKSGVDAA